MLLPVLAALIAPFLAIFARAFKLVPALVAIVLKILAALLALLASLAPGFVPIVDSVPPLIVAIRRTLTPVRSLFRADRSLSGAWPFGWQLSRTVADTASYARACSRGGTEKITATFCWEL